MANWDWDPFTDYGYGRGGGMSDLDFWDWDLPLPAEGKRYRPPRGGRRREGIEYATGPNFVSLWRPRMDIRETDNEIFIELEIPAVCKDDINIELNNGVLTVTGQRKHILKSNEKYQRAERHYGDFRRVINVGEFVKPEDVKANFKDGILEISYPKKGEKVEVGRITVA